MAMMRLLSGAMGSSIHEPVYATFRDEGTHVESFGLEEPDRLGQS